MIGDGRILGMDRLQNNNVEFVAVMRREMRNA
jgi:hypothetical protein